MHLIWRGGLRFLSLKFGTGFLRMVPRSVPAGTAMPLPSAHLQKNPGAIVPHWLQVFCEIAVSIVRSHHPAVFRWERLQAEAAREFRDAQRSSKAIPEAINGVGAPGGCDAGCAGIWIFTRSRCRGRFGEIQRTLIQLEITIFCTSLVPS